MPEDPTKKRSEPDPSGERIADPEIRRRSRISIYWIIPLVTLLVAGWIGTKEIADRGPLVTIDMDYADGLQVGKTRIKYRGIDEGQKSHATDLASSDFPLA